MLFRDNYNSRSRVIVAICWCCCFAGSVYIVWVIAMHLTKVDVNLKIKINTKGLMSNVGGKLISC